MTMPGILAIVRLGSEMLTDADAGMSSSIGDALAGPPTGGRGRVPGADRFAQALRRHDAMAAESASASASASASKPEFAFVPVSGSPAVEASSAASRLDGSSASPVPPIGDMLVQAGEALGRDWSAARDAANVALHGPEQSMQQMFALHWRTLEAAHRVDLASKLVQKTSQAVDQLVRIQ